MACHKTRVLWGLLVGHLLLGFVCFKSIDKLIIKLIIKLILHHMYIGVLLSVLFVLKTPCDTLCLGKF